jgi:adenylate kinase
MSITCVVSMQVPEPELTKRLLHRAEQEGRTDDNPETIAARLKVYKEQTLPVGEHYQKLGKFYTIDGIGEMSEILHRIEKMIEKARK